ncbi:hypothetical protein GW17_00059530, partial [Ensete ventricosum]
MCDEIESCRIRSTHSCCVFVAKAARRGGQQWPAPMQGQPPMAKPRPRPPAKGRPAVARASLQGRPVRLAGLAACRGGACGHGLLRLASMGGGAGRRGDRPLAGWLPLGKGSRRLRMGSSGDDDDADGARG